MGLCQPAMHHWMHEADVVTSCFLDSQSYFGSSLFMLAQFVHCAPSRNSRQNLVQRKPLFLRRLEALLGAFQGARSISTQEVHDGCHVMRERYGVRVVQILTQCKRF